MNESLRKRKTTEVQISMDEIRVGLENKILWQVEFERRFWDKYQLGEVGLGKAEWCEFQRRDFWEDWKSSDFGNSIKESG